MKQPKPLMQVMAEFESKRPDGRGHRRPIDPNQETKVLSIRVVASTHETLKSIDPESLREHLNDLAEKFRQ